MALSAAHSTILKEEFPIFTGINLHTVRLSPLPALAAISVQLLRQNFPDQTMSTSVSAERATLLHESLMASRLRSRSALHAQSYRMTKAWPPALIFSVFELEAHHLFQNFRPLT